MLSKYTVNYPLQIFQMTLKAVKETILKLYEHFL